MNDDQTVTDPENLNQDPPVTESQEDDPYEKARKDVEALYGEALRDSQRQTLAAAKRIQEREEELERLKATKGDEPKLSGADFLADPQTSIASIVQKEVRAALSGINELASGMRAKSKFEGMKRNFLLHDKLGPIYRKVETHVDNMLSSLPDDQLTPQAFQATILSTFGAAQAGFIPGVTTEPKEPPVATLPSNVPNPKLKKKEDKPTFQLTESQKRVARIQGLTDEEYMAMLDSDGTVEDMNKRLKTD